MLNGTLISLKELEAHDLDQIFLWKETQDVYLFKGRYKFASQEDLNLNFIEYSFSQKIFMIKKAQTSIGIASCWAIDPRNRNCEFYAKIYDKDIDPQPYLTDAVDILVNFLFNHENLSKIYTHISDQADQVKPVLESLNFVKEGTLRDHRFIQGQYLDTLIYGRIARENNQVEIITK